MLKSITGISLAEKSSSSLLFGVTVKVSQWLCLNAWAEFDRVCACRVRMLVSFNCR